MLTLETIQLHSLTSVNRNAFFIFGLLLTVVMLLLPGIPVRFDHVIYLRIEDFLILGAFLYLFFKQPVAVFAVPKVFSFFITSIIISICINFRNIAYNDLFEIAKVVKWGMLCFIFMIGFSALDFRKLMQSSFIILAVFNVVQYFNSGSFNTMVEPLYADAEQLKNAVFVSFTGDYTTRLLGTLGNPNNNAILLAIFTMYFAFNWKSSLNKVLFCISVALILMCQSRTIVLALSLIFIVTLIVDYSRIKEHLVKLLLVVGVYAIVQFLNLDYLNMIFHGKAFAESNSVEHRIQKWGTMYQESSLSPIFGYGPNKDYLYSKGFSPENEYLLAKVRYGYVGLTAFLVLVLSPFYLFRKNWREHYFFFSVTLIFLITSGFNCPYSSYTLSAFYFLLFGIEFSKLMPDNKWNSPSCQ